VRSVSLLFCHDHRFFVAADGRIYSYGQYDITILNRYVEIFGDVTIAARGVALDEKADLSRYSLCSSENISFLWMPNLSSLRGLTVDRSAARRLLVEAVTHADVVIARLPSEIGLMALGTARNLGKPAGAEVVACVWDGLRSHGGLLSRLYAPLAYMRMRRAVATAGWAHYVTQHFLQARYPSTGKTLAASDVDLPEPDENILSRRLARISAAGPVTFGMIAALFHKEKGIDVAIKAFARARSERPDIRLKVLGPGDSAPWRKLARELGVEESVEFCGSLPRGEAVLKWIDGIDVYVQASFQEGLPRALMEAMSRACPALASSAGGTAELVEAECLHRPGDRKTLAQQMISACDIGWLHHSAARNFAVSGTYSSKRLREFQVEFWRKIMSSP